jgi:hypothetical protein
VVSRLVNHPSSEAWRARDISLASCRTSVRMAVSGVKVAARQISIGAGQDGNRLAINGDVCSTRPISRTARGPESSAHHSSSTRNSAAGWNVAIDFIAPQNQYPAAEPVNPVTSPSILQPATRAVVAAAACREADHRCR